MATGARALGAGLKRPVEPVKPFLGDWVALHGKGDIVAGQPDCPLERLHQQALPILDAVLRNTRDAVLVLDAEGRIEMVNPAAYDLFDAFTPINHANALNEKALIPALRAWLEHEIRLEHSGLRSAQLQIMPQRWVNVLLTPPQDAWPCWVAVVQDISPTMDAEALRSEFVRRAAHDLRGPLGVVRSSLSVLESLVISGDPMVDEVMGIAAHRLEEMQQMVEDLLNLDEISARRQLQIVPDDLSGLISEVVAGTAPDFAEQGLFCSSDMGALSGAAFDRRWVKLALQQMLKQSARQAPQGEAISIRAYQQGDLIHVEVSDTSPGFMPDVQARLFERFYRPPVADGRSRGTGLGLAMVKAIAEAHGGTAYVRCAAEAGCSYGLTISL